MLFERTENEYHSIYQNALLNENPGLDEFSYFNKIHVNL
jgi:hypothetical protein